MALLPLSKPDIPVYSPGDAIAAPPLHGPRAAVIAVDVRTSGLLYYDDDTPNDLAMPYSIAMVASILDDDNKLIPYDAIAFRCVVPGYITLDTDLNELMRNLEGVAFHMADTNAREKGRVAARAAFDAEGVPVPHVNTWVDGLTPYDPAEPTHGLNHTDAASLLAEFVGRFEGGAIIAGQNLRLTLEMMDRINFKLDVVPNVYHRQVEMYSVFLAGAVAAGGSLSGIPSLVETVDIPVEEQKDSLARAQYITAFLVSMSGEGALPGAMYVPDESIAGDVLDSGQVFVPVGNAGFDALSVTASIAGDGFSLPVGTVSVEGGEMTAIAVDFTAATADAYTGTLTLDDGTTSVDVVIDVTFTVTPDPE